MIEAKTAKLNDAQKRAVEAINGPVMVIAGPGTGKTQLLASRVVNILNKDNTLLPGNILCLTFTDAGQVAMQRRLIDLMGESGAHVAVHTFHSFGTEIINAHPDSFFNSVQFTASDELSTHEILLDILDSLPARHPLAVKHDGEYALIAAIKKRIGQFKKALTPTELSYVVKESLDFIDYIEPAIIDSFNVKTFTKKDIPAVEDLLTKALKYKLAPTKVSSIKALYEVFTETLTRAYADAAETNNTKPITEWKKPWFGKDQDSRPICPQRPVLEKLADLAVIYQAYQDELHERRLFDFDDMIMQAATGLEQKGDLAYELQEQFQYILVDEFQDTNVVQMRLLHALAAHPAHEGSPNVMVVGDDDQAIFAFQGAELSNILNFAETYPNSAQITLTENYRSSKDILGSARALITQGQDRLENYVKGIDKTLSPNADFKKPAQIKRRQFDLQNHEYEYIAADIKKQIELGVEPTEIAVIAREHKQLENILPYLFDKGIPVAYERRENALKNPKIGELLTLAKVVNYLSLNEPYLANELMPELLSADYWQVPAADIWRLSIASRQVKSEFESSKLWLNVMLENKGQLANIANFLLEAAKYSNGNSLESILDVLIGNDDDFVADTSDSESSEDKTGSKIASPFKAYYFSEQLLKNRPDAYIELLGALTALRRSLRAYKPDQAHKLSDFIEFCELANKAKVAIPVVGIHASDNNPINLLTAHGSKGLEFDTVYILSANQSIWETKGRGGGIALSPNLLSVAHMPNPDDNLRLFYVAMTRAKRQLFISSFLTAESGKETLPYAPLEDPSVQKIMPAPKDAIKLKDSAEQRVARAERHWQDKHLYVPNASVASLLKDRLSYYALSATHLNNYLDVVNGGPQKFFMHNLLQFPAAMSPSASFGSAMHSTLEFMHSHMIKNGNLPPGREAEAFFESSLKRKGLIKTDYNKFVGQGKASLKIVYKDRAALFNPKQLPEQDFKRQGVIVAGANLTGKIDVLEVTKNQANVIDYKTGKGSSTWDPKGKSGYDKQKLHRYKQQLYFYKLLVDNSRNFGAKGIKAQTGELVFVEPNTKDKIDVLQLDLNDKSELERLEKLIAAVWQRIINLDFPDVSEYSKDLKGIITFEDWLLDNTK